MNNPTLEGTIPKTTREAFKILDTLLSDEEKIQILSKDKLSFTLDAHFGLGMWIRNNWIYSDKEGIGLFAFKGNIDSLYILKDPDTQSEEFLGKYYDHLKRVWRKAPSKG